jgi:adenosylcobinamide-GDP ribazoletransferase
MTGRGAAPGEGARSGGLADAAAAAIGFLTVLSVPEDRAARGRSRATLFFPWVGLGLGALALALLRTPLDTTLSAVLAVAVLALATGGLHWDGWADVVDATVTPGVSRERRIEILRDPHVGAHAALGVALLALVRVLGLARAPAWAILLGPVLGRWSMVATLRWAPPLGDHGAGATLRPDARPVGAALAPAVLIAAFSWLGVPPAHVGVALAIGALAALVVAAFVVRRLGGMNGDAHGAVGLLVESLVWVIGAELVR